jgi:hypothetical protein
MRSKIRRSELPGLDVCRMNVRGFAGKGFRVRFENEGVEFLKLGI